jgi:hypothetical protein
VQPNREEPVPPNRGEPVPPNREAGAAKTQRTGAAQVDASLQAHQNEGKFDFLKTKGSTPTHSRPCTRSTFINWLNVLGGGPVVW